MFMTMYSDSEKNVVMFLPDDITDAEVVQLGDVLFPDEEDCVGSADKPTGYIDLYNLHARYPIDTILPDVFAPM